MTHKEVGISIHRQILMVFSFLLEWRHCILLWHFYGKETAGEKVRIQGIIVEFISVKCYNERAWEAKTASQALCVITEETGGNLS